jgi:glycosyltransferase involved in cell wall biosynthesis
MSVAIVFHQFGPYHHSRVRALQNVVADVIPVQVAEASRTYAWTRNADTVEDIVSLTQGAEEDAGFLQVFTAAYRLWKQKQVKIVFLPSYFPATSLALLLSAKCAGVKCIMMNESHAGTERATGIKRVAKKFLISLFDAAILGGTPHLRHFESLGMKPDQMTTGYDAIDNSYFTKNAHLAKANKDETRARMGLPKRYLLSLGRMVEKKNLTLLIEAYAKVKTMVPETDLKLVFVGSGDCQDTLIQQCKNLELSYTQQPMEDGENDVIFYGFRQIDENPSFYALAEAFVLPSMYEEWGLVVNEAMACGLPILVSNTVGSAEDLVIDGLNGFQFSPESADDLAEKIIQLEKNPELRLRMGTASEERISHWGCENFAEKAKKILGKVIK